MNHFRQKIHVKAIIGNIGLFLFIPAIMSLISIIISWVFKEYYSILPLIAVSLFNFIIAWVLYKLFFDPDKIHLWDAAISVALGWFFCPLFGSIPYFWISNILVSKNLATLPVLLLANPLNALFESFSGFTSSGLTLLKQICELPHVLQWLRSFQQWVGGIGLIIFVISVIEPNSEEYQLFFVETKTKGFKSKIYQTTRYTLLIYSIFTIVGIFLFALAKMPIWQAINHGLSAISTGGFTVTDDSFMQYSSIIKMISIIIVIFGAMSFSLHYKIFIQKRFKEFWQNIQNRVFYILIIVGSILLILLNLNQRKYLDYIFQWVSSLATCGFYSQNISLYTSATKMLMIFAMIIGGCSGSTVGGLKVRRFIFLFQSVIARMVSLTALKERYILRKKAVPKEQEPSGVYFSRTQKMERLYESSILFFIWIVTLFLGVFLLTFLEPNKKVINLFFDATSALSNVGLSSGVTVYTMNFFSKIVMIFLMWIGRLEIIPVIVLPFSFYSYFSKRKK